MYPEIEFKYSRIYNTVFKSYLEQDVIDQLPSYEKVLEIKDHFEEYWEQNGQNILTVLSEISGLNWNSKSIPVYFTSRSKTFSDPLTISISKIKDGIVELEDVKSLEIILIHELIHTLLSDNKESLNTLDEWINKNYKDEEHVTKVHIKVHTIEYAFHLKQGSLEDLQKKIQNLTDVNYARSWEIVEKESYQKIIELIS